jgi:hypothetical protein
MNIARNKAPLNERSHCRLTPATQTKGNGKKNNTNNGTNSVNRIVTANIARTNTNLILGSRL